MLRCSGSVLNLTAPAPQLRILRLGREKGVPTPCLRAQMLLGPVCWKTSGSPCCGSWGLELVVQGLLIGVLARDFECPYIQSLGQKQLP